MKKRILAGILALAMSFSMMGCKSEEQKKEQKQEINIQTMSFDKNKGKLQKEQL